MSIEQEQVFEIWFNWGSLSFLKSKNIVSIYKGSTKINLLLAYHFLYKNNKKKYRKSSQVQEYYTSFDVFVLKAEGCAVGKARGHFECRKYGLGAENCWHWADFGILLQWLSSLLPCNPAKMIIQPSAVSPPVLLRISPLVSKDAISWLLSLSLSTLRSARRRRSRLSCFVEEKSQNKIQDGALIVAYMFRRSANWLRSDESKSGNRLARIIQNFPRLLLLPSAKR